MRCGAVVELGKERVAAWPIVDDVRVAEARVENGLAVDSGERAVDRLEGVLRAGVRPGLEIRLVDLNDVRPSRLEVAKPSLTASVYASARSRSSA